MVLHIRTGTQKGHCANSCTTKDCITRQYDRQRTFEGGGKANGTVGAGAHLKDDHLKGYGQGKRKGSPLSAIEEMDDMEEADVSL